ncbi:unnamed protein product [Linum trigynum]|uniref:Uncharacterized protein n=1 Tax=Linum trigynum TaxID=586398 RepID=A0AAV2CV13_9ROSI
MVSTKSMKAAEKAAQAAGRNTEAGDVDLDGVVMEDVTELEAVKLVVHEHSDALARLEEDLARVQADAKADADDLRWRLEDLMRAIASLHAKGDGLGGAPTPAEAGSEGGGDAGASAAAATAAGEAVAGGTPAAATPAAQGGVALAKVGGGEGAAKAAAVQAGAPLVTAEGNRPAGTGPGRVDRTAVGLGSGLLPTPTAQEIAARKGKAKMAGYDADGPPMGNGSGPLGHYTNVHNGLGWLDLEEGPEYDQLNLADQQAQWAEPEVDLRRPGGPMRAGDQMGQGGSAPMGRTEADWAGAGRADTGRAGIGRTDADRTELSQTGPGRTGTGRPEVGRTGHRPSPTSKPIRWADSRGPVGGEGPYEMPHAPGGYPNHQGGYPGDYGHGNPSQMQYAPVGQPWRTPGNDRYGSEIEQKRREGKCFNCDGRFTIGHQCPKPDLMMLVGRWEDEAEDELEDGGNGEGEA